MRKRIAFRQLGRTSSHKWAMLRNMVTSLIEHERIVTTVAKAKEVQHLAERVITMVKRNTPPPTATAAATAGTSPVAPKIPGVSKTPHLFNAYRRLGEIVRTPVAVAKAVQVLGPRYHYRAGGYTRILKLSQRRAGDNAPMAVIEYVDRPGEIRAARPPRVLWQDDGAPVFWTDQGADDKAAEREAGLEDLEPMKH